jgi:pimeloyl-ACP methyl ester carboxylesterase
MDMFVSDLDAVRVAAGLDRLHLIGHSFGGLLGMHYAIAHPERVASLVLVESDPASREYWVAYRDIVDSRRRPDDRAALAALESSPGWGVDPALTERYLRIHWKTYFSSGQVPDNLEIHFDENLQANFAVTPGAVRRDLGSWDLHDRLDRIRCPVLAIYGRDSIFPGEAGERLCAHLRDATLDVLDDVGHFPMQEDPAAFDWSIRRFRARHPR